MRWLLGRLIPLASAAGAAMLALGSAPLAAQAVDATTARGAPQFQTIRIWSPVGERIDQWALPVAVTAPIGARLVVDVATAVAMVEVEPLGRGGERSTIRGLTDTQLRARWTFGADALVLTAGVNLPTGRSAIAEDEIVAAGRIGNDFLGFPISNMGTGLAATAGAAVARPLGAWNVGAGVAARYSGAYDVYDDASLPEVRYQPGSELRLRVGGDRPLAGGRLAVGLTFAGFAADEANGYAYGTGDRWIAQGSYARVVRGMDLALSGWTLLHGEGRGLTSAALPPERVTSLAGSVGLRVGGVRLEPHAEGRLWTRDGDRAGRLGVLGVRTRIAAFGVVLTPGIAEVSGTLTAPDGSSAKISGARVGVGVERR